MKLLLLGATGLSGRPLISEALSRSHQITIYGRNPSKLDPSLTSNTNVTIIQGNLDNETSLRSAIHGQDAVLSLLGPMPRHQPNDHVMTDSFKSIFSAMKAENVTRFVGTGVPIHLSQDKFSLALWLVQWYVRIFMPNIFRDGVGYTNVVATQKDIEWSFFRVMLANSKPKTGKVQLGYAGDGKLSFGFTRREDLAQVMLDEITERQWIKQMPYIRTS